MSYFDALIYVLRDNFSLFYFELTFSLNVCYYLGDSRQFLNQHIERLFDGQLQTFLCVLCQKDFRRKQICENHVENIHFPNSFIYNCKYCGETFNVRNKLYKHVNTSHYGLNKNGISF